MLLSISIILFIHLNINVFNIQSVSCKERMFKKILFNYQLLRWLISYSLYYDAQKNSWFIMVQM